MHSRLWLPTALAALAWLPAACADDRPGAAPADPGPGGSVSVGHGGKASSTAADGGQADGGTSQANAGEKSTAGEPAGDGGTGTGTAGTNATAGAGPDPIPPVGEAPICARAATFAAGALIALSGAGGDLLQAITASELTIAWQNGDSFFVADRADVSLPFGPALEVAGGSVFSAVALGPDGMVLVGVRQDLTIVEMTRGAGEAFDAASASAGDFQEFNATVSGIPSGSQVLSDAVVAANNQSFFFSHFLSAQGGARPTLFESVRAGGYWSFASADLGEVLHAQGSQRRIPTGVSSDLLTLFYRDEVEGDFRAAWRVNTQVPFDDAQALALGNGVQSAAPNAACSRIYFSAQGDDDLDLFVAALSPN